MLAAGSAAIATSVQIINHASGTVEVPTAVYAPKSTVELANNAQVTGGVAANLVRISNVARLTYSSAIKDVTQPGAVAVAGGGYRECTRAPTGSSPASGC